MTLALLFPGQGSQAVGMGAPLADAFQSARDVFAEVDEALGQKLSVLMREGPEDQLTLTENAQPALMAVSVAVIRVLKAEFGVDVAQAAFVAGHSLGEYSALAAAGALSVPDTARLLKLRGQAMQRAVPVGRGAMASLIGPRTDLALAEAEAVASSRAKSEFLAVMSHEIRTPLNGVLGVAALMEKKLEQEELRPYVRTVIDSGQSLLRLLTDALDMSRASAGMLTLEEEPLDLSAVAFDIDALWRARADEKSLGLTIRTDLAVPCVQADGMRLKQLLNNLIGNALKFTLKGEVVALIESHADGEVIFTVDDSGPGVPEAAAATIFDPFNTGKAGREGAGAGLGLAICRQIAERMGGAISLGASPQGGARFQVRLPLRVATESAAPAPAMAEPTPHDTLHVLVVDDNATNRFVAGKLLETFGCTCEMAENGREAVDAVMARPFDLALMDIKMPVMDGVAATRAIRALPDPDVRDFVHVVEDAGVDRVTGERLERGGADELQRRFGGDHPHGVAGLGELTAHGRRLVGGDPAGDADDDPLAIGHGGPQPLLLALGVLEQVLVDLAHRDRQRLLLQTGLDERADVLEDPVTELVVVVVDLTCTFGGVDHQRVLARRAVQQLVDGRVGDAQRRVVGAGGGRIEVHGGQPRVGVRGAHEKDLLAIRIEKLTTDQG